VGWRSVDFVHPARVELSPGHYIDPPGDDAPPGTNAVTSWWVVDRHAGAELEAALDEFVPRWLADTWGFRSVLIDP